MKNWFVSRNEKKFGPFTRDEIISMRQRNILFESDLIWKEGLKDWKALTTVEEFSAHAMLELKNEEEAEVLLNRRQWVRAKVEKEILLHDQQNLWKARTRSLSQGGALVEIDNPNLEPGTEVHIHFQPTKTEDQGFSCDAVIKAKRFSTDRLKFNSTFQYSVEFKKKDKGADEKLKDWVNTKLNL